jgi:hypothetical protein
MAKILKCPRCQEKIDVTDLSGGSSVRCDACGTMVKLASGATGRVPQAAPPPPPPPAAAAKPKDRSTKVRTAASPSPGRQTDLFRKMSNARAPGEKGRPKGGGGGEKGSGGMNPGMMIAIAAAVIVVLGGVAFAVLSGKEGGTPKGSASSEGKNKDAATGSKKKKKDDSKPYTPAPLPPSDTGVFKPGARGTIDKATTPMMPNIGADARTIYEGMISSGKVSEVVAQDFTWVTYVIDGMLSDTEAVAKGSMQAMHEIILKRKLDARMSDLAKNTAIGGFNIPDMRSGEYTYWAQWYFTASARNAIAGWAEGAGVDPSTTNSSSKVTPGNAATEPWEETLKKCRSGGFSNQSNPEYWEFQKIKTMGKSAYPHLVRFIDNEDTSLGTTAVLILKELSGRSDANSRVTEANKAKIKEDWEGWIKSGP